MKNIITEEFNVLHLSTKEKLVLKKIGELSKVKSSDYSLFNPYGIKTMQLFTSNYLTKFHEQYLLQKRQEGKVLTYELRGIAVFALEYELLE